MAKRSAGGPTKSEAIRKYKETHEDAGPTEIAAALTKEGLKCSPQFVSTVLSNDKRRGGKGKRKGGKRSSAKVKRDYEPLVMAKKLADKLGGVEKARAALDALARILD